MGKIKQKKIGSDRFLGKKGVRGPEGEKKIPVNYYLLYLLIPEC